jgi:hypothetical protein
MAAMMLSAAGNAIKMSGAPAPSSALAAKTYPVRMMKTGFRSLA